VNRANKYIDETMPWALAKDPARQGRLGTVLYNLLETIRVVTVMITPAMPELPAKVWAQTGADAAANTAWTATKWGQTQAGQKVSKGAALFPRIEYKEEKANMTEAAAKAGGVNTTANGDVTANGKTTEQVSVQVTGNANNANAEGKAEITIEDFAKIDLRVAEVLACEKVENTEKLLKLEIKIGDEVRTIVSGIAKHYTPEEMVGKKVIVVANLKPTKLRGILSKGMLLAASNEDTLEVLTVEKELPTGSRVK